MRPRIREWAKAQLAPLPSHPIPRTISAVIGGMRSPSSRRHSTRPVGYARLRMLAGSGRLLHRAETAVERVRRDDRRRAGDLRGRAQRPAAGVSVTDGFSGGRLAACLGSAFGADVFGTAASGRGAARSAWLRSPSASRARAAACLRCSRSHRAAADADLAGEAGEPAVGLLRRPAPALATRVGRRGVAGCGGRHRDELRLLRRAEQEIVGRRTRRIDVGGDGARRARPATAATVPGRRRLRTGRCWPSGNARGEHLVHAAVDAGVEPRHRRAPRNQLGGFSAPRPAASRARRRRRLRGSRRPGIWPRRRTPDRAWRWAR